MSDAPQKKALLAEDDVFIAMELSAALTHLGYDVVTVDSASKGSAQLQQWSESGVLPALIVTDYGLTDGKTGGTLIVDARNLYPSVPAMMVSGSKREAIEADLASKAIAPSSVEIIGKPFEERNLAAHINAATEKMSSSSVVSGKYINAEGERRSGVGSRSPF